MARPGITYDQVAAAADALLAETGTATLKAVRERLGSGGMGTIHKHLAVWNANRPKGPAPAVELPPDLVRGLSAWVAQAATAARSEVEDRLVQTQAEAVMLSQSSEELEMERDSLLEQGVILSTERDKAVATAVEREKEIARLVQEIGRERYLASAATVEAAKVKLKVEDQATHLAEIKTQVAQLGDLLAGERDAKAAAETRAAVLQAQLDNAQKSVADVEDRARDLQKRLDDATALSSSVRSEYERRMQEIDKQAKAAVATERAEAEKARVAAHSAAVEIADLKPRLEATRKKIEELEKAAQPKEEKS